MKWAPSCWNIIFERTCNKMERETYSLMKISLTCDDGLITLKWTNHTINCRRTPNCYFFTMSEYFSCFKGISEPGILTSCLFSFPSTWKLHASQKNTIKKRWVQFNNLYEPVTNFNTTLLFTLLTLHRNVNSYRNNWCPFWKHRWTELLRKPRQISAVLKDVLGCLLKQLTILRSPSDFIEGF